MINVTNKKELPALLSKKKTVFISPAWKLLTILEEIRLYKFEFVKEFAEEPIEIIIPRGAFQRFCREENMNIKHKTFVIEGMELTKLGDIVSDLVLKSKLFIDRYDLIGGREIKPSARKGDIEEVFWNKDSEYEWFCKLCGEFVDAQKKKVYGMTIFAHDKLHECPITRENQEDFLICLIDKNSGIIFNKNRGKVKLTEPEKQIEIWKDNKGFHMREINA